MIESTLVRQVAKDKLTGILHEYPGLLKELLVDYRFDKFVELCTSRCNQLYIASFVPSKQALIGFIEKVAVLYAEKQLDKLQGRNGDET